MATKTLTIMEDVYDLLIDHKNKNESFSEEIRRILSEKKRTHKLIEIFGILSNEEGEAMMRNLNERKELGSNRTEERLKEWRS